MRTILLSISLVWITVFSLHAQFPMGGGGGAGKGPTIKGKIQGRLVDSVTKEILPYASVTIKKKNSKIVLDGVLSEDNGSFTIENIATGTYDLYITFLGYQEKAVKAIETTLKSPDLNLGDIPIVADATVLNTVEIKEQRALIENKADKLVFNAENDASIAGGDATDVLRKVPMLTVDLNGNVSLRGSQNIRILINGKPSGMFSSNVADALKMFPADQIKQVEVITSPSAKYDAEGSAGIINIITKKQNIEGVAGSVNTSIGNRQNSLFTSLNAGKGRFGSSSNGAIFYSTPADGVVEFYREDNVNGNKRVITQNGTQRTARLGGNVGLSAFYDFNGYNSINSSFNIRGFGFDLDGVTNGTLPDLLTARTDTFVRTNKGLTSSYGYDWNTDYTHKFEKQEGREWSVGVQYSKQNNDVNTTIDESHDIYTLLDRNSQIINYGDNNEWTFQTDYTHPFTKATKLETGVKAIIRDIISEYNSEEPTAMGYVPLIGRFNYGQDVYSAYASLSTIIAKKYSIVTGLRFENTAIDGRDTEPSSIPFSNTYSNLLPNFAISRTFKNFRTLKLAYTQRIQRPSLQFINPFNNNADFLNRIEGNPYLDPEIVHQIETSFNFTVKGFTTFSSIFYKNTQDIIEQILKLDNTGLSVNTYQNIGSNNAVGLNTFISKTVGAFTLRTGGNIFTYDARGTINDVAVSRQTYEYNIFGGGEVKISSSIKGDFFGFFKSPTRTIQGDNPAFTIYGMGVRKEWKNWSLGMTLIEPFHADKFFRSNITTTTFKQTSSFSIPFRSIGVNFRYKFGNVDFKERKSKVKNSDMKEGGDGQGGGGGGIGPGGGNG
jgi:ferric enterobactin receptor